MLQPVSEPSTPAQSSRAKYPISELALFREFTRASYRATFGVEAPTFDILRPLKTWFDTTADTSKAGNLALYRVLGRDASGSATLDQIVMSAAEARSINIPESPQAGTSVRNVPLRGLLTNEQLRVEAEGVFVVRTDIAEETAGFTAADRQVLNSILAFLTKPPEGLRAGGLFGSSEVVLPVEPVRPALPYANSADAYWAAQPAEVQELRKLRHPTERQALANKLAAEGFAIDPRIMVNGWDPLSAMRLWQSAGYTWIPALGQPDIEVSPGFTFPGLKSYDPANPPPGSILVSTAFADGYEY